MRRYTVVLYLRVLRQTHIGVELCGLRAQKRTSTKNKVCATMLAKVATLDRSKHANSKNGRVFVKVSSLVHPATSSCCICSQPGSDQNKVAPFLSKKPCRFAVLSIILTSPFSSRRTAYCVFFSPPAHSLHVPQIIK